MENKAHQNHFFAIIEICFMSNSLIKKLDLVVLELKKPLCYTFKALYFGVCSFVWLDLVHIWT